MPLQALPYRGQTDSVQCSVLTRAASQGAQAGEEFSFNNKTRAPGHKPAGITMAQSSRLLPPVTVKKTSVNP
jgi:hypothetical protein